MYIDKHNRRSHIITTLSENIYFMILQPINCIKSWILNSNNNLSNQLKLSYSIHDMCMGSNKNKQYTERGLPAWQHHQQPSRLPQHLDVQHSQLIHHSQPQCSLQHWWQEKSSVSKSCSDYGTETYKRHVWMWTDIIGIWISTRLLMHRVVTKVWGQGISSRFSHRN